MGIPYLALTGELFDVFCEEYGENWSRHNGTVLYIVILRCFIGENLQV